MASLTYNGHESLSKLYIVMGREVGKGSLMGLQQLDMT